MELATADLRPLPVGDIEGRFHVPSYQRGYRWGELEVRRLLDDMWENGESTYYLQPVVVQPRGDGVWDLVDGQQRLTTLFLIRRYMLQEGLQKDEVRYSLEYQTRPESAEYLQQPDPALAQRNIDFFHIHAAHSAIDTWFSEQGGRRQYAANKLYNAFFETVKVIWYEVPPAVDATTLFTRLNVGRIALTDAELVKALLLSRVQTDQGSTSRARELAAQWDAVERDLRRPELWAFVSGLAGSGGTRIDLLLDTLAGGPLGRERPRFQTFETLRERIEHDPEAFWDDVLDLHSSILDWYENRDLFHKVGFLVAQGLAFADLVAASRDKRKSEFDDVLDGLIRDRLALTESGLRELGYGSRKAGLALLLMNVETVRRREHTGERYSFTEHVKGAWSLEHIHAQNAERLTTADQWREWLHLHRAALDDVPGLDMVQRRLLSEATEEVLAREVLTRDDFRELEHRYTQLLSLGHGVDGPDSISNLALLHSSDNTVLSNSTFAVKRARLLERDKAGGYIPACTRNVFLKYYAPDDGLQMHFWSSQDREHYLQAMLEALTPYLGPEDVDAEEVAS